MPALSQLVRDALQIEYPADLDAQFLRYADALIDWNQRINLTAITAPDEILVRHFLDSLTIASVCDLGRAQKVIDVGSGAGFPGIPLQLLYPHLHITLLEATGKKVTFLETVIELLSLANCTAVKGRAEEIGQMNAHRAVYDLVLARAVARLPILLEYLLPLAKVGGKCIAMKGRTAKQEMEDSTNALSVLGGKIERVDMFNLPGVEEEHYLITIQKVFATPSTYPRRPGLPTQNPL